MNALANTNHLISIENIEHVRATLTRISLLSVYASMSMESEVSHPSEVLLEKTFSQIHDDSNAIAERLHVLDDDSALVSGAIATLETISLLSIFMALSMPSNPSPTLLEKAFNRIYEACETFVSKLDEAEAAA